MSADAFAALLAQLPLRREASVELCSERCGAKCCRQRDAVIFMDTAEMRTLKRLGKDHRVSVPVRHEPQRLASSAPWALHFSDTGGKCPFNRKTVFQRGNHQHRNQNPQFYRLWHSKKLT